MTELRHGEEHAQPTPIRTVDSGGDPPGEADPGSLILTCSNCGAQMTERTCTLI